MQLKEIQEIDKACYMNTFGTRLPLLPVSGKGCRFQTADGREYTDFLGGIAVNVLGHAHPGLARALYAQAKSLVHVSNVMYNSPQTLLAQRLHALSGGYKVFFGNSGAEANEAAFKLARIYFYRKGEERYEIISAQNSFHGRTLATVAATGQEKYQAPYRPLPAGFKQVPYASLSALKKAITPQTAAILLETIQGEGGVIEGGKRYLQAVQSLCREKGILLILDEIQTGIGRTGKMFSFEHYGITPDIFTLAKGLGGGVPIGAVLARPEVADAFTPGDHGTTFGGNPLACAAGLYVLSEIEKKKLVARSRSMGYRLKKGLKELAKKHPSITGVRGLGLLVGLELAESVSGKAVVTKALAAGYLINCAGHNTLRFAPPLVVTRTETDGLLAVLDKILTETEDLA